MAFSVNSWHLCHNHSAKYKSKKNADLCDYLNKSLILNRSHQKPANLTVYLVFGCPQVISEFMLKAHKLSDFERTEKHGTSPHTKRTRNPTSA